MLHSFIKYGFHCEQTGTCKKPAEHAGKKNLLLKKSERTIKMGGCSMKKRLLAIFLALCLVMGLLPAGAMAAGGDTNGNQGKAEGTTVPATAFTVYKDEKDSGRPSEAVPAGDLSENAPDLSGENLYFDHAEINGKRVYEVGVLQDTSGDLTYYGSITGALSILGAGETIGLYYVSKYPVDYAIKMARCIRTETLWWRKGNP